MSKKNNNNTWYVYILTNPSFREDWIKIGKSSRPVNIRSKELDNTAVPLPFEIYATMQTSKYEKVEKLVHRSIDRLSDLRIRQTREFFNIKPDEALAIFYDIADTLDDAVIQEYEKNEVVKTFRWEWIYENKNIKKKNNIIEKNDRTLEKKETRRDFTFDIVWIKKWESLIFNPTWIIVTVYSDNKIEYKWKVYTMTWFTKKFIPNNQRNKSDSYQWPKYFSYKWEILTKMRESSVGVYKDAGNSVNVDNSRIMDCRGCNGKLIVKNNSFIIQRWSVWNLDSSDSMPEWYRKVKEKLIQEWIIIVKGTKIRFVKKYKCASWSEAAVLLAWCSMNWRTSWKKDWKTAKELWL